MGTMQASREKFVLDKDAVLWYNVLIEDGGNTMRHDERMLTLTRQEAAEHLHVSLPTLDAWLRRSADPLPHIRAGRHIVIPRAGLEKWLAEEAARQQDGRTV